MSKKGKTYQPVSSNQRAKLSQKTRQQYRNSRWIIFGLMAVLVLAAGFLLKPNSTQSTDITVAQAYQKYQQGAFFLDMRSKEEWDQSHIEGSTVVPLDELSGRLSEIPSDRDIVVVCRSGNRSKEGVSILKQAGFMSISSLSGGLSAWDAAGYSLESNNP